MKAMKAALEMMKFKMMTASDDSTTARVVGRDGGALRRLADACILVPAVIPGNVTAQTESMQALLWHLMVMHPDLLAATPKWESMEDELTGSA